MSNFETGDKYDAVINLSRIRNHPWAIDWQHDLWPWMTLNCPRSGSQNFLIKYLEYEDRYNAGLKRDQIGNHQWAFDWPYVLLSWMTLNWPTSRSSKLQVKYRESGENHPYAIDWHHELWPCMTLNRPRSRSGIFAANISNMVTDIMLDSNEVR